VAAIVALVEDLMFLSRIREAAKGPGVEVRAARTVEQLLTAARSSGLVLVDLDSGRLPTAAALAALKADPALAALPVIGFFSHVHTERADEVRQAGVTKVLARSAFVNALPALLAQAADD
jgi:CheY-like chemotaxis protein